MDHKGLAADERHELADLLSGLTAAQWDATSLCGQWPVRDVAAHVITYLDRDRLDWTTAIALHRLDIDRLNATDVERSAELAPGDIVDSMSANIAPHSVGAGFGGRIALLECMIHQQDIRRPLNLPRTIPSERLRAALNFARMSPVIRGGWHARGVRLIATDLDWSAGRGPNARGPAEALLMAMALRPSALTQLTGPGTAILRQRQQD
jgi:uncharacterized protein (TIGR03083 family)